MKDIRILLVDSHELVRLGVRDMLKREEDMEVVGDCSSTEEALLLAEIISPNIVLMEDRMPGVGGFEITRRLHQKRMPCNVVMLTQREDCLTEAREAGMAGCLLEDISPQELAKAIRRVYHGELVIDGRLASTLQTAEGESECPPLEGDGALVKEVELTTPLPFDAVQLLSFIYQIEEVLGATIVQQVGSWNRDTVITISLGIAAPLADIVNRLGEIPGVDGVSEKPAAKYMVKHETRPRKQLLVTLKQASPAK